MKSTIVMSTLILAGLCAVAGAQQRPPQQQPPGAAGPSYGLPPVLPVAPLDESQLSDEDKKRLEAFRKGGLPEGATFEDLVAWFLTPRAYPKEAVVKIDEKHANPHPGMSGWIMEIVREEGDTIWLKGLPPENPDSMLHTLWERREQAELYAKQEAPNWERAFFLDFKAELVPPPFMESLHFEPSSARLPAQGRWQMSFALADMNGDGIDDLVFPPQRLGVAHPSIFLGSGKGQFAYWSEARWTGQVPWDYGGVAAADLDGDGDQDLVFGIHFKPQFVVFNGGDGTFGEFKQLPSPDPRVSSRAPAVADFDGDGRLDVAFLAEINYDQSTSQPVETAPTLWVVLNRADGTWEVKGRKDLGAEGLPHLVIGDNLRADDVDRDGRPDLVLASTMTDFRHLVFLNRGADGWEALEDRGVLSNAYHFDVLLDPAGGEVRQLFGAFNQFLLVDGQNKVLTGIIRYQWSAEGVVSDGVPLVVAAEPTVPYFRLAVGDLNGDGRTDLVAGRKNGGLEVFIQTEDGDFYLEKSPELEAPGTAYHIQLVDLDGDGLDDIAASFATKDERPGGVRVWLTRTGT